MTLDAHFCQNEFWYFRGFFILEWENFKIKNCLSRKTVQERFELWKDYYTQRNRCQLTRCRVDQHSSSVRSLMAFGVLLERDNCYFFFGFFFREKKQFWLLENEHKKRLKKLFDRFLMSCNFDKYFDSFCTYNGHFWQEFPRVIFIIKFFMYKN